MEAEEENKAPEYARKSGKHKGSNAGLKAFVIAQVGRMAWCDLWGLGTPEAAYDLADVAAVPGKSLKFKS